MGEIIGFIIWTVGGCFIIGIGISAFFRKKAVGFWANIEAEPVNDIKDYCGAFMCFFSVRRIDSLKKSIYIAFIILMLTCIGGCSAGTGKNYSVVQGDLEYQVNVEEKTISDGNYVYGYSKNGTDENYTITIYYPDGTAYWMEKNGALEVSGGSYDESKFSNGSVLCEILEKTPSKDMVASRMIPGVIIIIFGLIYLCFPRIPWKIEHIIRAWAYKEKNLTPSKTAIIVIRVIGVILVLGGLMFMM